MTYTWGKGMIANSISHRWIQLFPARTLLIMGALHHDYAAHHSTLYELSAAAKED